MTSGTHRTRIHITPRGLAVFGFALLLIGLALAAAAAEAQGETKPAPTRYVSIFDSATTTTTTMTTVPTVVAPMATDEVTVEASPSPAPTQAATVVPQVTRYSSVFDSPAANASPAPPTAAASATTNASAATPAPQVTRYTSVFDAPASSASPVPSNDSAAATPAPQVTRYTSVFDSPSSAASTDATPAPGATPASGAPTRIPSVFDSQPSAPANNAASGAPNAPTPYKSVFDAAPGATVRYDGEDAPPAEYCLKCHASPYLQMSLPDGEVISVTVDEDAYQESVHGQHGTDGYRCIRCHVGMNEYPHAPVAAQTSRELVIELSTACARCHTDKYDETRDDLHVALLARGVENAATCADCHTAHEVQRLSDETTGDMLPGSSATSAKMCSGCHSEIYAQYSQSVHGQSVLSGNNDAAACADCHGTTVSLFQSTSPDQAFNAPVCADCHGVHNIMAVENADSPVIKDNLIETCRRCHPSATTNFSSAWLSHYPPTFEHAPIVALANLAYTVAIPAVVGVLALFVIADARRRRSEHEKEH